VKVFIVLFSLIDYKIRFEKKKNQECEKIFHGTQIRNIHLGLEQTKMFIFLVNRRVESKFTDTRLHYEKEQMTAYTSYLSHYLKVVL